MAEVLAVIPIRYGAQRFPGKALAPILGRPMLEWVIKGVREAKQIHRLLVATDDQRIAEVCDQSKVPWVMTDPSLPSGTDRVYQAIKEDPAELVINVQGDEPLIQGQILDQMAKTMLQNEDWDMMTLGRPIDEEALHSPQTAKIVLNHLSQAIYFSRFPIPYSRVKASDSYSACLKHIGIYGYKKDFLRRFCEAPPTEMEQMEGLEQLRALYLGGRIKVLKVDFESWGVDTPADVARVEQLLKERHG